MIKKGDPWEAMSGKRAHRERGDAIKLLKEFLFHAGEQGDWMKHIK
jgi:hypothetical protein